MECYEVIHFKAVAWGNWTSHSASVQLLLLVGDGWRIPPFLPSTGQIPSQLDVC